jgi:hypothetical protein
LSPPIIAALTAPSSLLAAVTPSSPSFVGSSGEPEPTLTPLFCPDYNTFHVASPADLTQNGGSHDASDFFDIDSL